MRVRFIVFFISWIVFALIARAEADQLRLWYNAPAKDWMVDALPIGNGYMGAMFFGGTAVERIQFAEESLWRGGPGSNTDYNFGMVQSKEKWRVLPRVRKLINAGEYEDAHELFAREMTGGMTRHGKYKFGDFGGYQPMGDIFIKTELKDDVTDYIRELDIEKSEGRVSFQSGGVDHNRTYFASYPDRVLVYELNSSEETTYRVRIETPHESPEVVYEGGVYKLQAEVADNQMRFETRLRVETDGDVPYWEDGELVLPAATSVVLAHSAATEYLLSYPQYRGNDYTAELDGIFDSVSLMGVDDLKKRHRSDYSKLFGRVEFDLAGTDHSELPTDLRALRRGLADGDNGLAVLYLQYARYLTISASREGTMPMNLQGKWNEDIFPKWACDYHSNINLEMLYWPTESLNLSECHLPLFDHLESLVEPGQIVAKEFFNSDGWVVNTMNNTFGYTAPGWKFPWGHFPEGAAWLCLHSWEHYQYTLDEGFLRDTAYPLMKGAAEFWVDYLSETESGELIAFPSYSPEHGGISKGASMTHQIVYNLMNNCAEAAEILGIEDEFVKAVRDAKDRIASPRIGSWGQLQEWLEEKDDPNSKHRHISHLFALYPGNSISPERTPRLAEAAKTSLSARGDSGTGWSLAWKINFWARLHDGDRAFKLLCNLMEPVGFGDAKIKQGKGGIYANFLCAHPPFQLDGNMGGAAGIVEMLMQSHNGFVDVLPALPSVWREGSISGLVARGNLEVDLKWREGRLTKVCLKGRPGQAIKYRLPGGAVQSGFADESGALRIELE